MAFFFYTHFRWKIELPIKKCVQRLDDKFSILHHIRCLDAEQKSKIADSESGSTNEGDANEAESGDFGSGENSGSGSGSGEEPTEPTVLKAAVPVKSKKATVNAAATKATITKAKEEKKKDEKKKETKSKVG